MMRGQIIACCGLAALTPQIASAQVGTEQPPYRLIPDRESFLLGRMRDLRSGDVVGRFFMGFPDSAILGSEIAITELGVSLPRDTRLEPAILVNWASEAFPQGSIVFCLDRRHDINVRLRQARRRVPGRTRLCLVDHDGGRRNHDGGVFEAAFIDGLQESALLRPTQINATPYRLTPTEQLDSSATVTLTFSGFPVFGRSLSLTLRYSDNRALANASQLYIYRQDFWCEYNVPYYFFVRAPDSGAQRLSFFGIEADVEQLDRAGGRLRMQLNSVDPMQIVSIARTGSVLTPHQQTMIPESRRAQWAGECQ